MGSPFSSGLVAEGVGDGDGKAEIDETFSIWIRPELPFDPSGTATWHPSIPINNKNNPDIIVEDIKQHRYSTGRSILSAQIRLNRTPTKDVPVRIPVQVEWLKVNYLEDDCHRNAADRFDYSYHELVIYHDGTAGIEKR